MPTSRECVDDLCRTVVSRGWMSARTAKKAALLCELGLHPEQAFVGTGLLNADAFGNAFSGADAPVPEKQTAAIRAMRLIRKILDAAHAAKAHHIYFEQHPHGSIVILSHDVRRPPSFSFPSALFSALRMRLRRFAAASGWNVEEQPKGNGFVLLLSRPIFASSLPHPLDASDAWRSFWEKPEGLLVLRGDDPAWRQVMRSVPQSVLCVETNDADAGEEALHAALSGKTVIAHAPVLSEPWWRAGAEAGIPVRVIRAHAHADGTSWEAHRLSESDGV